MLTILTGRVGSGKTYSLLSHAAELIESGEQGLLIVPEQYTLTAEHDLLDRLSVPGLMFSQVVSPSRLARNSLERLGCRVRPVVDARGQAMMLRKAFSSSDYKWEYYGKMARNSGFFCEMADFIGDMKRFCVDDQALEAVGRGRIPGILGRKIRDIGKMYRLLSMDMEASGAWNTEDRMAAYIEAIPDDPQLDNTHVWMDGFDYLPPLSIRLICALAKKCPSVTIALDCANAGDPDYGIFTAGLQSYDRLIREADAQKIHWERKVYLGDHRKDASLRLAERALFSDRPEETADSGSIHFMTASDTMEEILAAGDRVRRLVMEGSRYGDIQIACSNLPVYQGDIEYYWGKMGIPFYLDTKRDAMTHPAVEILMACLDFLAWGWRWPDLIRMLKTGLTPLTQREILTAQHYLQAVEPLGKRRINRPWNRKVRGEQPADAEAVRRRIVTPLAAADKRVGNGASAEIWRETIIGLFDTWGVEARLQRLAEERLARGDDAGAQENLQIWRILLETLEQLEAFSGETVYEPADLKRLMETGLRAASIGTLPSNRDAVLVGDIGRTKTHPKQHVLLLGATEDWLPSTFPEDGVITGREARLLAGEQCEIGRNMEVRNAQSRFAVHSCIAKTEKSLWLFRPLKDEAGQATGCSPVEARLSELTGVKTKPFDPADSVLPYAALRWLIPRLGSGGEKERQMSAALSTLPDMALTLKKQNALIHREADLVAGGLPTETHTSVSKLETFADCPFQWFMEYIVRPGQPESLLGDPLIWGNFRHAAAQQFLEAWMDESDAAHTFEWGEKNIRKITDGLRRSPEYENYNNSLMQEYVFERLAEDCRITAQSVLLQFVPGGYRPTYLELSFGKGGEMADLKLPLKNGETVSLTGKVDRVDVLQLDSRDILRVIDYKAKEAIDLGNEASIRQGNLQVWVYMSALLQRWEQMKGRKAVPGGLYVMPSAVRMKMAKKERTIPEEALSLSGVTAETPEGAEDKTLLAGVFHENPVRISEGVLRQRLRLADETAAELAERALRGEVSPKPMDKAIWDSRLRKCKYCDYRAGCLFRLRNGEQPVGSEIRITDDEKRGVTE